MWCIELDKSKIDRVRNELATGINSFIIQFETDENCSHELKIGDQIGLYEKRSEEIFAVGKVETITKSADYQNYDRVIVRCKLDIVSCENSKDCEVSEK